METLPPKKVNVQHFRKKIFPSFCYHLLQKACQSLDIVSPSAVDLL